MAVQILLPKTSLGADLRTPTPRLRTPPSCWGSEMWSKAEPPWSSGRYSASNWLDWTAAVLTLVSRPDIYSERHPEEKSERPCDILQMTERKRKLKRGNMWSFLGLYKCKIMEIVSVEMLQWKQYLVSIDVAMEMTSVWLFQWLVDVTMGTIFYQCRCYSGNCTSADVAVVSLDVAVKILLTVSVCSIQYP